MAKEISPAKGRYFFDGGLNTKFQRSIIADNESPSCQNVVFTNGKVATRNGFKLLNTTPVATAAIDGLYVRHSNSGAKTMIAFCNGSAWALGGTSTFTTIASAQSVFTAGIRVGAAEYQNHLFVGNGGVIPYKWNGTDWTRHGVYPATTTMAVVTGAGGNPNGAYTYKMTYVNTQSVESDVGPITATLTVVSSKVEISTIPVAPQSFGVSSRRIYRTVTSGSVYKLLTTIADNTTTTYSDDIADSSLGATAPSDHGVPPKYSTIVYHRDRLFCNDPANPNFVNYSNLQEPYTFGALNIRRFGDNTADIVRALAVDGENVVIFGDSSIEIIYMPDTTDSNWLNIRVKADFGCKSPYGIVRYDNGLLFPAMQNNQFIGFAHLTGDAVAPSATFLTISTAGSSLLSDKIEPNMTAIKDSDVGNISGMVYENKAYFSMPATSASTENDVVYVFDFTISDLSKKTPYSWVPWTGLRPSQLVEYNGLIYYGDSRANGSIYYENVGVYSDVSTTAIDSYYWTKEFGGNEGDFSYTKDFRTANILVDLAGDYFMNVSARVDSDSGSGNVQTINLDPGGTLWGTMVWGTSTWGGGNLQSLERLDLGTLSGNRIQFKFDNQNTAGQKFGVHSLNFLANIKGYR